MLSLEYIRAATITAAQQIAPWETEAADHWSTNSRRTQINYAEAIEWYPHRAKAQRRYDEPDGAQVVAANWNGPVMERAARLFEEAGAAILWCDEVDQCAECYGAIDTSPHSYGHRPEYVRLDDGAAICISCLLYADPDRPEEGYSDLLADYLAQYEDDASRAVPYHITEEILEELGYRKLPNPNTPSFTGDYETGWHPGQDDSPGAVFDYRQRQGYRRLLFRISSHGQFDTRWQAWGVDPNEGTDFSADRNAGVA